MPVVRIRPTGGRRSVPRVPHRQCRPSVLPTHRVSGLRSSDEVVGRQNSSVVKGSHGNESERTSTTSVVTERQTVRDRVGDPSWVRSLLLSPSPTGKSSRTGLTVKEEDRVEDNGVFHSTPHKVRLVGRCLTESVLRS